MNSAKILHAVRSAITAITELLVAVGDDKNKQGIREGKENLTKSLYFTYL